MLENNCLGEFDVSISKETFCKALRLIREQEEINREFMLQGFLERNAISKEQYEKSYHDLTEKMGYGAES